MENTPR